jgi:hypothetical protein
MGFAGRAHHTATLVPGAVGAFGVGADDEIWVVGGTDAGDFYAEARVYTPATGEWRDETPNLSGNRELLRRAAHGAASLSATPQQIVLHAGAKVGGYLDDLVLLDTRSRKVSALSPKGGVPQRRGYHVFAALGPLFVVFGGRAGDGAQREQLQASETFKVYDPSAKRWLPTRATGVEPAARWHAAAAALPAAGALLLHGGTGAGKAQLGDAHVLRCSGPGHALSWHALRGGAPPPRAYHVAAATWAPGSPMRVLFAGGGATDATDADRHFTLCGDAFLLTLPRPPWDDPESAPREPPRAVPTQAPAPAPAGDGDAGADEASQWRKRPRGNAAATATAPVGRRAGLNLAPAADVRAAEAVAASEERLRSLEREAASLHAALDEANSGWAKQNAELIALRRSADGATGDAAALRAQLVDIQSARLAAETAAARASGEARAATAARDATAREAAEARSAAATASVDAQIATSREAATAQLAAEEREAARVAAEGLRGALAAAEGARAAAEAREAGLKRGAEESRNALAEARRERNEADARGAEALREVAAARDAVMRERDTLRVSRADAEEARNRAQLMASDANKRAADAEAAARAAERDAAEQRAAVEALRAQLAATHRTADELRGVVNQLMAPVEALRRIADDLGPQQAGGDGRRQTGAEGRRRGDAPDWQRR